MISPTGRTAIRGKDPHGCGEYGADRGSGKIHDGVDFVVKPGQKILSPITGLIVREARPYPGKSYSGVLIEAPRITILLFYFKPDHRLIGAKVRRGDIIGVAQKISDLYEGMIDHIHLRIKSLDPTILLNIP